MDSWYFAYGSNLRSDQMVARTGLPRSSDERPRIARLPNYRLVFNMRGDDGRIYANVMVSEPHDLVRGVLYRCAPADMKVLDDYEAGYERRQVTVADEIGREYAATVYVGLPECTVEPGQPTTRYRDIILTGAREFGLPNEYLERIERLASGPA